MFLSITIKRVSIQLMLFLFFSACGGSGTSESTTNNFNSEAVNTTIEPQFEEVTGQFIDGPVAGLSYRCSSGRSGTTDNEGKFTCYDGNTITFKVGDVFLGEILVDQIITPLSLYPNSPQAAVNVARLLQSLDDDDDLTSINIDSTEVRGLDASLDVKSDSFEQKLTQMLSKPLVSKEDAIEHVNKNLEAIANTTSLSSDGMAFVEHEPTSSSQDVQGATGLITGLDPSEMQTTNLSSSSSSSNDQIAFDECQIGIAYHEGKVADFSTGKPLVGVEVTLNGCTTHSDSDGHYELPNIKVDDMATVTFRLDGYYPNSVITAIKQYSTDTKSLSPNYLEATLDKYDISWSFDSNEITQGAHLLIPSSSFKNLANEESFRGTVHASLAYEDESSSKTRDTFPGTFSGMSKDGVIAPFLAYRFMVLELKDSKGNQLELSNKATLRFPNVTDTEEQYIPLWYYDYDQGLWIEEGYAAKQADGSYEGSILHAGTWALSQPIEETLGIYRGKLIDIENNLLKDTRVFAVGKNWISMDLSTDQDGIFELYVIPDNEFTLKVYDFKNQNMASYNGILPGISAGDVIQNRM